VAQTGFSPRWVRRVGDRHDVRTPPGLAHDLRCPSAAPAELSVGGHTVDRMTGQLWVTALGGAAAGAFLTGVVTLITTLLNRRHEHRRWLLDQRLHSYAAFNQAMNRWAVGRKSAEANRLLLDLTAEGQRVRLVAPPATAQAVAELVREAIDKGLEATGVPTRTLHELQVLDIQQEPRAARLATTARKIAAGAGRVRRRDA